MVKIYSRKNSENNELKRFMEDAYVTSPYTQEIFKMIKTLHSTVESKPRIGILTGPTDSGKSSAIKQYKKEYREAYSNIQEYKDCEPFLGAAMSAASTRHELMTLLLESAGDIHPSIGSLSQKETRLKELAITLDSSLVVIDDFGRLLRDSGTSFNKTMCNYIQYLSEVVLKIPFLLLGVDECRFIFDRMKELNRRTPIKYRMKSFRMNTDANSKRFERFLQVLEKGIPKKSVSLSGGIMPKRLFLASNGVPGPIKTLIEQAYLVSDKNTEITLADFEQAYDQIYEESTENENEKNQLATKAVIKSRKKPKPLEDNYTYQAPYNPFRESVSTAKLDKCIGALCV